MRRLHVCVCRNVPLSWWRRRSGRVQASLLYLPHSWDNKQDWPSWGHAEVTLIPANTAATALPQLSVWAARLVECVCVCVVCVCAGVEAGSCGNDLLTPGKLPSSCGVSVMTNACFSPQDEIPTL